MLLIKRIFLVALLLPSLSISQEADIQAGKSLFNANCAACHQLNRKAVGPALSGVTEKYDREWLYNWIKNGTQMIKDGDPQAVAIWEEYNRAVMTNYPQFSNEQIDNILAYTDYTPPPPAVTVAASAQTVSQGSDISVNVILAVTIVIFTILIVMLFLVQRTLIKIANASGVKIEIDTKSNITPLWQTIVKNQFLIFILVVGFLLSSAYFTYGYLMQVGIDQGYAPIQPIHYSHKILRLMAEDRKSGKLKNIEPDSKSQVTFEYIDGKPSKVKSVVISSQHSPDVNQSQVRDLLRPYMLKSIPENFLDGFNEDEFYVNPTGNFVIGGPDGDCGLTGRKIIVDTYGGAAPHGGGAFSGKDPTKVDRSAAYAARYIAKNVVGSKIAEKCLIQLAYAIGVSKPLSIYVDLFDNDLDKNKFVVEKIKENFDLSPRGIREMLNLNKPIYEKTSAYGHFGRTPDDKGSFSWEKTDKTRHFSK